MVTIRAVLFFIFLLFVSVLNAQTLSVGVENGINFSNVRKTFDGTRFQAEAGPAGGLFVKYDFGDWFTVQTGVSYATIYTGNTIFYAYPSGSFYPASSSYYDPALASSYYIAPPYYNLKNSKFSFARIPVIVSFKTPGRLSFEIGAGVFQSYLTNDEYRGKDILQYTDQYIAENFPPMNDRGLIFRSSLNYFVRSNWSVSLSGQITSGEKEYFESVRGKVGTTEIALGVAYHPFSGRKFSFATDSGKNNLLILPHSGINISNTRSPKNKEHYQTSVGFSSGVTLKFLLDRNVSFLSGAWYDRKGYGLNYSGFYRGFYQEPTGSNAKNANQIESEVQLDYLTVPLMFEIRAGKKVKSGVMFGLYFSQLQNAFAIGQQIEKHEYSGGFNVQKRYFNDSLDEWFTNSDYGFTMGYRLELPVFSWGSAFVAVNQSFGLKNILEKDPEIAASHLFVVNERMLNNSTSLLFGVSVPLIKPLSK